MALNALSPPRKILALKLRSMGDTVLMTAPVAELRRAFPNSEIHAAVLTPWVTLLESDPAIKKVWGFDRHEDTASRAKAVARFAFRLRKEKFDCVVNFHASPSSSMIAFATGARLRSIHFHGLRDKNRYSTVEIPGKGTVKPNTERDMDAVRALGIAVPAGQLPRIHLTDADREQARSYVKKLGLAQPLLVLGLGASRPAKSWPMERFAKLALAWSESQQGGVLAVAGSDEREPINEFMSAIEGREPGRLAFRDRIRATRSLSLRQLAAVLAEASIFAGNDSGPKHIAVAVGTPTVTLFGPEHPLEWHPYPTDRHPYVFVEELNCRRDAQPGMPPWCGLNTCEIEQHRCMRMIEPEKVLELCDRKKKAL